MQVVTLSWDSVWVIAFGVFWGILLYKIIINGIKWWDERTKRKHEDERLKIQAEREAHLAEKAAEHESKEAASPQQRAEEEEFFKTFEPLLSKIN